MYMFIKQTKCPYRRVLAVGDIHGMSGRFFSLMDKVDFKPEDDLLILLGDYIDRGDGSLLVLTYIRDMVRGGNCIALRGNHEQMMLDYLRFGMDEWLENGGQVTLEKYDTLPEKQQKNLQEFMQNMPLYYRLNVPVKSCFPFVSKCKSFLFTHAGIQPDVPLDRQGAEMLFLRPEQFADYSGPATLVVGHTPTLFLGDLGFRPIKRDKIIYLDTGSYFPDGCISCVDLLSGNIYRSR